MPKGPRSTVGGRRPFTSQDDRARWRRLADEAPPKPRPSAAEKLSQAARDLARAEAKFWQLLDTYPRRSKPRGHPQNLKRALVARYITRAALQLADLRRAARYYTRRAKKVTGRNGN